MSESEDGGPGRREVAHRLFAAEFDDSEFSYSESDEERAPNYVVTPTGARVNRLFVVGVLTELEQVNDEVLRARIVDPTGPFVVYAGQYQPEALAFLEAATPPLFVAVTGKARTFEPEDSDRVFTSIRPESISEVDAETRDRWAVQAAEQTIERVGVLASAKQSGLSGEQLQVALTDAGLEESAAAGAALALEYYGTTGDYLQAVRDLATNAAEVVAGQRDEAGSLSVAPDDGGDVPLASLASMELAAPDPEPRSSGAATEPPDADPDGAPSTDSATETSEAAGSATGTSEATDSVAESSEPAQTDASVSDEPAATPTGEDSDGPAEAASTAEPVDSEPTETSASTDTAEPTTASEQSTGDDSDTLGDFDAGGSEAADDAEALDTEFELDEDEREEIEAEYGTDFQSGTEVDEPGAADIDTPDPEELAEMEADEQSATEPASGPSGGATDSETAATDETAEAATAVDADADDATAAADAADEPVADVDLEDAVMDVMTELNDGGGADREAVRSTVADRYGASPDEIDDAIQDALMGGRCYEPEDGKLTPI